MPRPVVTDPRQNHHGWWGTFTLVEDENGLEKDYGLTPDSKASDCLYVFLKTSRDAHFIAQGTTLDDLFLLGENQEDAMATLEKNNQNHGWDLSEEVLELIRSDLKNVDERAGVRYYTFKAIDHDRSTALARVHTLTTEACFNNDHWLGCAGDIGQSHVRLGRGLKRLQPKESVSYHAN